MCSNESKEAPLANVTLSIDDALLLAARVRAVQESTSVNEVCRRAIEAYARRQGDSLERYRALQARLDAEPGTAGRQRPAQGREGLYDTLFSERSATR